MKQVKLSYWLLFSLICIYSIRCWISFFPALHLPFLSTIFGALTVFVPIITFGVAFSKHQIRVETTDQRNLILLLTIYVAYCAYYVVHPQVSEPQAVPESVGAVLYSFMTLYMMIFLSSAILKKCDIVVVAKVSVAIILVFLLFYFTHFNIALYGMMYGLSDSERESLVPEGFLGALSMSTYLSVAYCGNLYLLDKWTKSSFWNKAITITIAIVLFLIQFMIVERGPVLSMLMVTIFYFACRNSISGKTVILLLIVSLLLYFFQDLIFSFLSQLSDSTVQKFIKTMDNGGNGRFGDDDAIFPSAIRQISEGPLFGSYFRVKYGNVVGTYPHNIVLELLMTFGLVFSLPMFVLMYKAVKKSFHLSKTPYFFFCLIFVNRLLFHLTSGTVINDRTFWLSLALILCYSNKKIKSQKK